MRDHDDRPTNKPLTDRAAERPGRLDDAEERMLSEGRRLSVWALIGAAAFVVAMIALTFAVFKSGGPNPDAATSSPAVDQPSSEGP